MFFILTFHAQQGKVWATIPIKKVPKLVDGNWVSDDPSFNKAIDNLKIQSIKKALPSSRSLKLQRVYEITCDCDEVDLYTTLTNNVQVLSGIEYAPKYETLDIPNDYTSLISSSAYALDLINAPAAWDITHGDPNVYVAITEPNYHSDHPDLIDKIVYYDASNTGPQGHGTAVAITAAGSTNNGVGIASIGYDTKLALYHWDFDDILAASYAGAKVINMSWTSSCDFGQYEQDVINEAYNNGTFLVASAGNGTTCYDPSSIVYPASYENVFSVTSVGPNNNHEKIMGNPNSTHQHNSEVDLSAPGYDVLVSAAPGWNLFVNGTSYAAAYVTGTIGLMLAVNPNLTNEEIEEILK
ncbi:MAG: S8 family peptidase, partial [Crocinitomicaceae bacterium]